ncbi:MAG: hypothetical protein QM758_25900 [Armatimonas sp.]
MKRLLTALAVLLMLIQVALAHAAEPKIPMTSVKITTQRFTRWNPDGRKEPVYGQWSWTPRITFNVVGPLEGGSQLVVNFSKPDGSAWLSVPLKTPELDEDHWETIDMPDFPEGKAVTFVGSCPVQIVLKNSLTNTKKVLFTGKYEMKKFKDPFDKAPGATEFYVDHDWTLGHGFAVENEDETAPNVELRMWMRGTSRDISDHLAGYLFFNGKQISSSKNGSNGSQLIMADDKVITTPGVNKGDPCWYRLKVVTYNVRAFVNPEFADRMKGNTIHYLKDNPGEYELKITWDGKPIRSMKFTADKDGKIVDNGQNKKLNTPWIVLPVTTEPGGMPGANLTAFKTGAFYGNPL